MQSPARWPASCGRASVRRSSATDAARRLIAVQLDVFRAVGGAPFFVALVDRFYTRVEADPVLRKLYPEDLTEPKRHLMLFLVQYWGGPPVYGEQRGHPRLRMRHAPFVIGEAERDAWYRAMEASVVEAGLDPKIERRFLEYFALSADHMINSAS
jgi:hemoglobin